MNFTEGNNISTSKATPSDVSSNYSILVNKNQKLNPLLKFVRNVPWEIEDIVSDYQMGKTTCALFLSLHYHNLKPDYIHERLKKLGNTYKLRILLVHVDIEEPYHTLKNLTRMCILADLTLILAWSPEEAGKIIETYKIYENKPADNIMEKSESSPYLQLIRALTAVKSINKTDATNLVGKFKTLKAIIKAKDYELAECPGLGPRKAKNLYNALHEKFCK